MDKNWCYLNKGARLLVIGSIMGSLLAGCGGGGGGGGAVSGAVISGTAATGAPIVGQVVAIDAKGAKFSATTSASGAYTVNVAGGTAPFILTVIGTAGGKATTLTSVATAPGQTVNITPLTDLIVSIAAGQPGGATLANLCTSSVVADQMACQTALTAATTPANLTVAVTAVTNMVAATATAVGGVSKPDLLNGAFMANGTGMDKVLDAILVAPATTQTGTGAQATVTLIAVPGAAGQLGTVSLPNAAGTVAATTVTPISPTLTSSIATATTASTALVDIQACLASFNALYPANMTTPPTAAQVTPFIDPSFSFGGPGSTMNQAWGITQQTTLVSAGGVAKPGFALTAVSLASFDFTHQMTAPASWNTASPVSATTAWVKTDVSSWGGDYMNLKMVKTTDTTGCPSGWKIAGRDHVEMHMNARVRKSNFSAVVTYSRELPFHVPTKQAVAEGIGSIIVNGPGLNVYNPARATGVGTAMPITLVTPPVPTVGVRLSAMVVQGQSVGNFEAIPSCQDLVGTAAVAGNPCYDEAAVAPGAVFTWTVYDTATTPAVKYVFPHQIDAVPLSMAFIKANDKDLFAQNISATPAGPLALNTAAAGFTAATSTIVGQALDNVIMFNYTQSAVYGARTNHCNIGVTDANNAVILQAEQNAVGTATQQTSCIFITAGLNSGSLTKPASAFGGTNGWMSVANFVLGNMAASSQPYTDPATTPVPTPTPTPTTTTPAIVGSWYLSGGPNFVAGGGPGESVLAFFADGTYMHSQSVMPGTAAQQAALQVWPGLEQGTYTWNSSTGVFTNTCPTVDTNGTAGLSGIAPGGYSGGRPIGTACPYSVNTINGVTVSGNTLSIGVSTFTRVIDPVNAIVGSWYLSGGPNFVAGGGPGESVISFFAGGTYMHSQSVMPGTAAQQAALQVWPGLEQGTYTWNSSTGVFANTCPTVDTNGTAGLSGIAPGGYAGGLPIGTACSYSTNTINSVTVSVNTLSINGNTFTRVGP